LSVAERKDLLTLTASQTQCEMPGVMESWLSAVRNIADKTTPFLPAPELEPVWRAIDGSPCYQLAKGADLALLQFFEALATRDRAAIVSTGRAILGASPAPADSLRVELVLGVSAALLGGDDPDSGVTFLEGEIALINRHRQNNLAVRLVEAFAAAQKTASAGTVRTAGS
jgi:hypothetical protein